MPRAAGSASSDLPPGPTIIQTTGDKAVWLERDEKHLIEYLIEHKAEAGDNGNFKSSTFRGAAEHLEVTRTKGAKKTARSCEAKYRQLRKLWALVDVILGVSGWTWSDKKGVNVTPASQGSWDAWVAVNKDAKRFRNKGWPFYDLLLPLMPQKAKGTNVFRPGEQQEPGSPPWDMSQMEDVFAQNNDGTSGASEGTSGRDEDEGNGDGDGGDGDGDGDDDDDDDRDKHGDNDGDNGEDEDKSSSPAPASRRMPAQPTPMYRKKARLSAGAQGLIDLNQTAMEFNEIFSGFRNMFTTPDSSTAPTPGASTSTTPAPTHLSPQRRSSAIKLAKEETWLSKPHRVALVQILRDVTQADVYLQLVDEEEMRVLWVIDELADKKNIYAFHPEYSSLEF
ncbi:hypothetical protein B0H16DRAFT_1425954 [Mycena metata]|uniref:Myb/SANT-like domain-containing protein n=1 Tax=Mycena metata TaxID=1033252 RepID=A0AAD7I724_9AGAR|nr:hypothetical protein B0H16DRAFT_1387807 [Mycena metata]KAJ7735744.1 hypothetical protein B0H16DRAFT_1425954 [Mycena metata]